MYIPSAITEASVRQRDMKNIRKTSKLCRYSQCNKISFGEAQQSEWKIKK